MKVFEIIKKALNINKKGQVTFGNAPQFVIALVLMGMVAAAGVISLVAFKSSTADEAAISSINSTVSGIGNFTSQLSTVGTMLGVGLILLIVLGIFAIRGRNL